jgi:hypothetical protein
MLQSFLDRGMLDIGEDDERFKHLRNAAQDIAEQLADQPQDAIAFTLVALDPTIAPAEPVLDVVEATLKGHWNTFRNRFPDRPRQILRAVVLEALHSAGSKDPAIAAIIWLTGGNVLPHSELGREHDLCKQLLVEMGQLAEERAAKFWSTAPGYSPPDLPAFQLKLPGLKAPGVNAEELTMHLAAAVGPNAQEIDISQLTPNPYWANSPQNWAYEFAPRAADGIVKVVNTAQGGLAGRVAQVLTQLPEQITAHIAAVDDAVRDALDQVVAGAAANERRVGLLWWKQTLYSATLHRGYRSLDAAAASVLMAYDLHRQVPAFCPEGVEYLLREAVREVVEAREADGSGDVTLLQWCEHLNSSPEAPALREALGSAADAPGRVPLLRFMRRLLEGAAVIRAELAARIGVDCDTTITPGEFAVWIFRDLQAERLAAEGDG